MDVAELREPLVQKTFRKGLRVYNKFVTQFEHIKDESAPHSEFRKNVQGHFEQLVIAHQKDDLNGMYEVKNKMCKANEDADFDPTVDVLNHFIKPNVFAQLVKQAKEGQNEQSALNEWCLNILFALTKHLKSISSKL